MFAYPDNNRTYRKVADSQKDILVTDPASRALRPWLSCCDGQCYVWELRSRAESLTLRIPGKEFCLEQLSQLRCLRFEVARDLSNTRRWTSVVLEGDFALRIEQYWSIQLGASPSFTHLFYPLPIARQMGYEMVEAPTGQSSANSSTTKVTPWDGAERRQAGGAAPLRGACSYFPAVPTSRLAALGGHFPPFSGAW